MAVFSSLIVIIIFEYIFLLFAGLGESPILYMDSYQTKVLEGWVFYHGYFRNLNGLS